jgi:Fic family protein
VSGKDKYRDAVNAFGQSTFIPPAPHLLMDALTKWKNYLNSEEKDPILPPAVLKAQFEHIHPFHYGNGSIERNAGN